MRKRLFGLNGLSHFRSRVLGILVFLLISGSATGLWADIVSVGQFAIEYPSVEAVGYYGFTVTNLTGNSSSGSSYPVTTALSFLNPQLTVSYGYAQIDPSTGVYDASTLTEQATYTATPNPVTDPDPFNISYNGCGIYGVDNMCAGTDDTGNAFQLSSIPIADSSGNNLVILSATLSIDVASVNTNVGTTLAGQYTTTLFPPTDCNGPCNFLDPGLYPGDPNTGYWEYFDNTADIVIQATPPTSTVPEPATIVLLAPALAWVGWRRRVLSKGEK